MMRRFFAFHAALTVLLCCCSSTTPYYKALSAAGELAAQAPDLIESYDKVKQEAVLADVSAGKLTIDSAKVVIDDYRVKRMRAAAAIVDLQTLVTAGKSILALVDSGAKPLSDVGPYMATVGSCVLALRQMLQDLGVKLP